MDQSFGRIEVIKLWTSKVRMLDILYNRIKKDGKHIKIRPQLVYNYIKVKYLVKLKKRIGF